jgi:hypothetical protein
MTDFHWAQRLFNTCSVLLVISTCGTLAFTATNNWLGALFGICLAITTGAIAAFLVDLASEHDEWGKPEPAKRKR